MAERQQFSFLNWLLLTLLGVVTGLMCFILAGIPLVALRRLCGRSGFWAGSLLMVSVLLQLKFAAAAALLLVLSFVIALYAELRLTHLSPSKAGLFSLAAAILAVVGGISVWVHLFGWEPLENIKQFVFSMGNQLKELQPQLNVSMEMVWRQLPAFVVIAIAATLTVGLVFESRVVNRLNQRSKSDETMRLYEFRNPDVLVWASILSALGAFLELGWPEIQVISINVFYVLVFLYFLQGLAVITTLFAILRMAPFWQWAWVIIITLQLLPIVSFIGFVDYWMNFRERIIRKGQAGRRGSAR